jgi:hypothetical protein
MDQGKVKERPKHGHAQGANHHEQRQRLEVSTRWQHTAPTPAPDEKERCHHQSANGIAQPPGAPRLPVLGRRNDVTQPSAGDTQGGAQQGTEPRCQHDQAQDIPEPIEGRTQSDHPRQEHHADQGFERVAQRHAARNKEWGARRPVDEPGAHRDAWPQASAVQDQRGQGNAGRQPDGRRKPAYRVQGEANPGGRDINESQQACAHDNRYAHDIFYLWRFALMIVRVCAIRPRPCGSLTGHPAHAGRG